MLTSSVHDEAIRKADVLVEALGYIRQFRGRYTVIKLGGSVMEDNDALQALLFDIVFMQTVGMCPVVVHGGGKAISAEMARSGLRTHWVQGRRYTDAETLKIVAEVLVGGVNETIRRHIIKFGGRAAGLHHRTVPCLVGRRLNLHDEQGDPIDLGYVGQVATVDVDLIEDHCRAGTVPVIPSLAQDGPDPEAGLLNVNADTAAAAVASALRAEKLVFLTDTPGILIDRGDPDSLQSALDPERCQSLIADGTIDGGMIPKIEAGLESLHAGVRKTHIIDGRLRHSLLLEIYTDRGIGTQITLEPMRNR